jgi:hypothetical protein
VVVYRSVAAFDRAGRPFLRSSAMRVRLTVDLADEDREIIARAVDLGAGRRRKATRQEVRQWILEAVGSHLEDIYHEWNK